MVRRRFSDRMPSAAALWGRRLAIFALVVAALSVIVIRSELLEIGPSLATFGAALVFACIAILLGLLGVINIWRYGLAGLGSALLAILLGAALLPYPAYLAYRGHNRPSIADVTTDLADPPRYDVIARLRDPGSNNFLPAQAEKQRALYPDLESIRLNSPPQIAYDVALGVVTKHKWRVVDARAPIIGRRDGIIEAVARSPVMGFRDYLVIRVRGNATSSRIDIRSASRYPFLDFGGENATRVRTVADDIDEANSAAQDKLEKEAERAAERAEKNAEKAGAAKKNQPQRNNRR